MVSLPHPSLLKVLEYSDRFNYPLTLSEIRYWQTGHIFSLAGVRRQFKNYSPHRGEFYFLPRHSSVVALRRAHAAASRGKWTIARGICTRLSHIPTIAAIFVTGALAMNNSPIEDDIDIMVVTQPHTLWLTRLLVVSYLTLHRLRRPPYLPEHSSRRVADKICDNLYLDLNHLAIPHYSGDPLYFAHEVLQATPVVDKQGVAHDFLSANAWVADYLPVAYKSRLAVPASRFSASLSPFVSGLLSIFNTLLFLLQYLYMRPRLNGEKVAPGYAFFHPRVKI